MGDKKHSMLKLDDKDGSRSPRCSPARCSRPSRCSLVSRPSRAELDKLDGIIRMDDKFSIPRRSAAKSNASLVRISDQIVVTVTTSQSQDKNTSRSGSLWNPQRFSLEALERISLDLGLDGVQVPVPAQIDPWQIMFVLVIIFLALTTLYAFYHSHVLGQTDLTLDAGPGRFMT